MRDVAVERGFRSLPPPSGDTGAAPMLPIPQPRRLGPLPLSLRPGLLIDEIAAAGGHVAPVGGALPPASMYGSGGAGRGYATSAPHAPVSPLRPLYLRTAAGAPSTMRASSTMVQYHNGWAPVPAAPPPSAPLLPPLSRPPAAMPLDYYGGAAAAAASSYHPHHHPHHHHHHQPPPPLMSVTLRPGWPPGSMGATGGMMMR